MKKAKRLVAIILISIVIVTIKVGPLFALTMDEAKTVAREQGTKLTEAELAYEIALKHLGKTRRNLGMGIYGSDSLYKEVNELEIAVEEWEDKIAGKRDRANTLVDEKQELKEDSKEYRELKQELENLHKVKATLKDELVDLRIGRANLLIRYRSAKAMEDRYGDQLDAVEEGLDAAEDALKIKPMLLDYMVEETFLSLLLLKEQEDVLTQVITYREQLQEKGKNKFKLGLLTPAAVSEFTEMVRAGENDLQNIRTKKNEAMRAFKNLLGLSPNKNISLQQVENLLPSMDKIEAMVTPDLKSSVFYIRAEENVRRAARDLEDASPFDRREYSLAELRLEEAEISLENTLKELETNYRNEKEKLKSARDAYEKAVMVLEGEERRFLDREAKYRQGIISGLAIKGKQLAILEKEAAYLGAKKRLYLQKQIYILAREGIESEVKIPVNN